MKDIIILGASGLAREVAFLIEELNRIKPTWNILGFAGVEREKIGQSVGRYKIVCAEDDLFDMQVAAAIGIGTPLILKKIAERFASYTGVEFPNLIHPSTVWDQERIIMGQGNIVCAGNIFTTDIKIGSFNYFNLNCTYGHDVEIGNCSVFNPGINLSGGVKIGDACLIGTGATILQYLTLGDNVTVGAGAVVTKNVEPNTTVVGVPAKQLVPRLNQGNG
ncbi:MAG: acetyltransferase [Chloroflexi bacterium]|nr:acetyltransferase [Chloroflexota bacterium]